MSSLKNHRGAPSCLCCRKAPATERREEKSQKSSRAPFLPMLAVSPRCRKRIGEGEEKSRKSSKAPPSCLRCRCKAPAAERGDRLAGWRLAGRSSTQAALVRDWPQRQPSLSHRPGTGSSGTQPH